MRTAPVPDKPRRDSPNPRRALNENEIRTLAQYLELDTDAVGVARLHYLLVEDPPCAFELNATKLEAIVRSGQADVFMVRRARTEGKCPYAHRD